MPVKHKIRSKDGKGLVDVVLTRNDAIKAMCTECMGFETSPRECTSIYCPLFPYRGKKMLAWKDSSLKGIV